MTQQRNHQRFRPHRSGAAALELAVVAPVFFLLVFGMIEFGRAVMIKQAVTDAARAGTRKAILATTQTSDQVESTAKEYIATATSQTGACVVTVSPNDLSNIERGTEITTSVQINFSKVSWLIPSFMSEMMLTGETTMARE